MFLVLLDSKTPNSNRITYYIILSQSFPISLHQIYKTSKAFSASIQNRNLHIDLLGVDHPSGMHPEGLQHTGSHYVNILRVHFPAVYSPSVPHSLIYVEIIPQVSFHFLFTIFTKMLTIFMIY